MATQLQIRRGSDSQVSAFTGAEGEIVVNTTNDSIHVNDGSTAGGFELARADLNNVSDTDLNAALTGNTVSALTVTSLTSSGIDVTGVITTDGMTTSADINFGDNDKAIFGAGSDLQIYHDGSNSYIDDAGTGDLLIRAENNLYLKRTNSDETYLRGLVNDSVTLYHNNNAKLATTITGIDVTGTVTADSAKVENSTTSTVTISESTGSGTAELRFVATESFPKTKIVTDVSAGSLSLETLGNERLNIANNGDISFYEDTGTTPKLFWDASAESLGIGTSSPSSYNIAGDNLVIAETTGGAGLTLASSTTGSGHILFADGTSGTGAYDGFIRFDHTTSSMRFASGGGVERMRIDSTSIKPTVPIEIGSSSYFLGNATNGYRFNNAANTSNLMILQDSGNLLVGSSSSPQISAGSVARIQVIAESSGATAFSPSLPASATGTSIRSQSVTAAGTGWNHFVGSSGNGSSLTANNIFIYGNGDIGNTNNTYGAISDAKLKENITDATPKLADINAVRVVNYNLIDHPEVKQLGVIAQELEQIFPSMVSETPDRDMEGNDLGTVTKSVKYSVFVPMLIKAIQEQQATITALEARITQLENH